MFWTLQSSRNTVSIHETSDAHHSVAPSRVGRFAHDSSRPAERVAPFGSIATPAETRQKFDCARRGSLAAPPIAVDTISDGPGAGQPGSKEAASRCSRHRPQRHDAGPPAPFRAYVTAQRGSFNASLFALRFADTDADHAGFLAAFLRSRLGAYLVLMPAPSSVVERTHIERRELFDLPFHLPGPLGTPTTRCSALTGLRSGSHRAKTSR